MKNVTSILLIIVCFASGYGQSTIRPNIYFQDMNYYNIAAIPLIDSQQARFSFYSKYQFLENDNEVWSKPPLFLLDIFGNLKNQHSYYNIGIATDQYSFYSRNTGYAGYTHRFHLGKSGNHTIDIGGRFIFNLDLINWDKLQLPSKETGKSLKPNADIDWGAYYRSRNFSLGISTKNMFSTSVKSDDENLLMNQREFYVHTSYRFQIKDRFEIEPYLLYRKELGSELDIGLHLGLYDWLDIAYQFRLLQLKHIFILQGYITPSYSIGISFDQSPLVTDKNIDLLFRYNFRK